MAAFLSISSESSLLEFLINKGTERWLRLLHLFCHSIGGDRACVKRLSQWTAHYSEKIQFCARGIFIPRAENTFQKPQLHRVSKQFSHCLSNEMNYTLSTNMPLYFSLI